MNVSMLLSAVTVTFAFLSYAHADNFIPESTADIQRCFDWAKTVGEHGRKRCIALNNCMRDQSDNEEELQRCFFKVEREFYDATNGNQAPKYQSSSGVASPVVTETADSYYERKPGGKGWTNSEQP